MVAHEAKLPAQGEVAKRLKGIARRARGIATKIDLVTDHLRQFVVDLKQHDELTRAALSLGRQEIRAGGRGLGPDVYELELQIGEAMRLLAGVPAVAEQAEIAIELKQEELKRGPREHIQLGRAGKAVRILFRLHGLPFTVTETRDFTVDSPAVRVFRIVTGLEDQRVERYLKSA
jgi:hypothetical protein